MTKTGSLFAGKPERSRRRRTPVRKFLYRALAPLIDVFARAVWSTCRKVDADSDTGDRHAWSAALAEPCVPCFWHEQLVPCIQRLRQERATAERLAYLVSPSIDGDLFAQVLERGGSHVVRGSSTRSGLRAMRGLQRAIKQGFSPVITPDGPTGPVREAKPGAVVLSQVAGVPILPIACAPAGCWRAPSWDRLIVPLPFGRVAFAIGQPIDVPRNADDAQIESARVQLEQQLSGLTERCRARLKR